MGSAAPTWFVVTFFVLLIVGPALAAYLDERKHTGPAFIEADDVTRSAEIAKQNARQLEITREAYAPPPGRNDVAHAECSIAGHDWIPVAIIERCARCGIRRPRQEFSYHPGGHVKAGSAIIIGETVDRRTFNVVDEPSPNVDPTRDEHEAFSKLFAVTDEELCAQNGHQVTPGVLIPICVRCGRRV